MEYDLLEVCLFWLLIFGGSVFRFWCFGFGCGLMSLVEVVDLCEVEEEFRYMGLEVCFWFDI